MQDSSTYFKGSYKATLDHICAPAHLIGEFSCFEIICNPIDCSDHRPVSCKLTCNRDNYSSQCGMEDMAKL